MIADAPKGNLPGLQAVLSLDKMEARKVGESGIGSALRGKLNCLGYGAVLQVENVGFPYFSLPGGGGDAENEVPFVHHILAENILGSKRTIHEYLYIRRIGAPQHRGTAVEKLLFVELGSGGDAVDLFGELADFILNVFPVCIGKGVVGGLHRKLPHALQNVVNGSQGALGGLEQRGTVFGVAYRLVQAAYLGPHLFTYRKPCRIIRRCAYAKPLGKTTYTFCQAPLQRLCRIGGKKSGNVGKYAQ